MLLFTGALLPGEIFSVPIFPFNLPAPIFNAVEALLIGFPIRICALFDILLDINIYRIFDTLSVFIYPFVFVIVLIGGYVAILQDLVRTDQSDSKEIRQDTAAAKTGDAVTWEDGGNECRQGFTTY